MSTPPSIGERIMLASLITLVVVLVSGILVLALVAIAQAFPFLVVPAAIVFVVVFIAVFRGMSESPR